MVWKSHHLAIFSGFVQSTSTETKYGTDLMKSESSGKFLEDEPEKWR
jgi:hypothetical protein